MIVLAGILFQLITTTIFVVLGFDFLVHVLIARPRAFQLRLAKIGFKIVRQGLESENHNEKATTAPQLEKANILLAGTAFATAMIYVRGIYRSIELAEGWKGFLMTHEVYFIFLDGLPMVLCFSALAIFHPAFLLPVGETKIQLSR